MNRIQPPAVKQQTDDFSRSPLRIGSGAGFSGDRIDPAVALVEYGRLDYLVFECLAERTIALAVQARRENPEAGYDPLLDERMRAVLPLAVRNGVCIISNMGAANPAGAARRTAAIARELGLTSMRIAAVLGDDVYTWAARQSVLPTEASRFVRWPDDMVSANAYLGCAPIVEALQQGAHIVLTGRVADPSLYLAPLVHEFGWRMDDWHRLGSGTVVGHLLECAGQVTGGYFADTGRKEIPNLAELGFPLAEVHSDGSAVITKLEAAGGAVTVATCTEQLLYELHDPARYLTPDVTADFSNVTLTQLGPDRVLVEGASGAPRPERLKVSIGYRDGFLGEGQLSYAGPGAVERGRLACAILERRFERYADDIVEARFELIGCDAIAGSKARTTPEAPAAEVRMRVAARTRTLEVARQIGREVESLYTNGPAGGGGATQSARPSIAIAATAIHSEEIETKLLWERVE